jgi:hypothetical protein
MARRRVFKTRAKCSGITTDLGLTSNRQQMIGRQVTLEKAPDSQVNVTLDGAIVGQLDTVVGPQVASAIKHGQSFTATIRNAFPVYDAAFKQTGAELDIKVEYLLDKGQPAIETPRSSETSSTIVKSFFTRIAGVTHEGRQQIIARCSVGESLILVRDPDNRFDKGAIKVLRSTGEQLGFIPADVSRGGNPSGLAYSMDHGSRYQCRISDITGGGEKWLGMNIELTEITEKESYEDLVQRRIRELTDVNHQQVSQTVDSPFESARRDDDVTPKTASANRNYFGWLIVVVVAVVLFAVIFWMKS